MKRFAILLLLVLAIPVFGLLVGSFAKTRSESKYFDLIKEKWGEDVAKKATTGEFSLEKVALRADLANDEFVQNYNYVRILQKSSVATIAVGVSLLLIIFVAGVFASLHRRLLLVLFAPGLKLVLLVLLGIILAQGAIAAYGIFILETTLLNTFHPFIIGSIAIATVVGSISMIIGGFSISKRVSLVVKGVRLSKEEEPELWDFVEQIAKKLNATVPKNIVVGLEPNFYVTNAEVVVHPEDVKYSKETLYLSLPFIRIFTKDELRAVIGHELGHFRGDDTKFSLKFYPIYAGTNKALQALLSGSQSGAWITVLPAYVLLLFFMERFSIAENKISRLRELQADKAGSEASSSTALISALLKLGALASLWQGVKQSMIEALNQGKVLINVSALYAESAIDSLDKEMLFSGVNTSIPHPTDSHPTISQRMESLGYSVGGFKATYGTPDLSESAVVLLRNPVEIEEKITDFEHRVLLALGLARLPEVSI